MKAHGKVCSSVVCPPFTLLPPIVHSVRTALSSRSASSRRWSGRWRRTRRRSSTKSRSTTRGSCTARKRATWVWREKLESCHKRCNEVFPPSQCVCVCVGVFVRLTRWLVSRRCRYSSTTCRNNWMRKTPTCANWSRSSRGSWGWYAP